MKRFASWGIGGLVGAGCGLILAALPDVGSPLSGWLAFVVLGAACGFAVGGAWTWLVGERPERKLFIVLAVAVGLRLAIGVGFRWALPAWGNPEIHHEDGYFYPDGHERDLEAWGLANSGRPLTRAFSQPFSDDPYGGQLFLSAAVYRGLSLDAHRPLLPLLLSVAASGLAVLFTWSFVRRIFGEGEASVAAWIVAVYPDAVLLGASHMREPFIVAGLAAAMEGYARFRERDRRGLVLVAAGLLGALFFSPPFAIVGTIIVGGAWIWEGRAGRRAGAWVALGLAASLVVAVLLTARAWTMLDDGAGGLGQAFGWWWGGVAYELQQLQEASGWVQQVFGVTPAWTHPWLAAMYGVIQPLLPAAVFDRGGAALMQGIMILRSLGWFALLPFFLYAVLRSFSGKTGRSLASFMAWVVLVAVVLISYRYAGDQWDNPRYRVGFLALQAAVVAWAWFHARAEGDPWLARIAGLVILETLVFSTWYAGRYLHTPRLSLGKTAAVGLIAGVGWCVYGLWRDRGQRRRLTGPGPDV